MNIGEPAAPDIVLPPPLTTSESKLNIAIGWVKEISEAIVIIAPELTAAMSSPSVLTIVVVLV